MPTECRDDLVRIDGAPIPATLVGSTADAVALKPLHLAACSDAGAVIDVALGAGRHEVSTTVGGTTGLNVDRAVWASGSNGEPSAALTVNGTVTGEPVSGAPVVKVVRSGRVRTTAEVTGASSPFWFVLGQSDNAGWRATVDGKDLGPSTLVDGFANGWLISPHSPTVTIELEWVPERTVQRSIAISVVAIMLCLGIVVFSHPRSRRVDLRALMLEVEGTPTLARAEPTSPASWVVAAFTALAVAGAGSIVVRPEVGVAVGIVVLGAMRDRRIRLALEFVPAVMIALAGGYIAYRQARYELPPIFEWPTLFARAWTLGWIAIVVLGANAIVGLVLDRRGRRSGVDLG